MRRHGIGLRICQVNEQCEMTMKTAGQGIGGLHQHKEFNVPLQGPTLDLARLPVQVWPPELNSAALQSRLKPLPPISHAKSGV